MVSTTLPFPAPPWRGGTLTGVASLSGSLVCPGSLLTLRFSLTGHEQAAEPSKHLESISEVDYEEMLKRQILGQREKRPRILNFGATPAPAFVSSLPTASTQPKEETWGRRHISTTPDRILDAPGAATLPF